MKKCQITVCAQKKQTIKGSALMHVRVNSATLMGKNLFNTAKHNCGFFLHISTY